MFRILLTQSSSILHLETHVTSRIVASSLHTGTPCLWKKWRFKRVKAVNVDVSLLKLGQPVSGSLSVDEDLAKLNSRTVEFDLTALTKKGFLRFQKAYDAPPTAIEQFLSLVKSLNPQFSKVPDLELVDYKLSDSRFKYDLLSQAQKDFEHGVPNSILHHIVTIRDAAKFYNTSVSTNTPYDDLLTAIDLPQNLYLQKEPLRFNPETETMFDGISAFPKSSTIVSGLRARKKYKTIHAKRTYINFK